VPDGISLRNFGIQVPIYATLSDIVIYSPKGATRTAFALAEKFKLAIEAKMVERMERLRAEGDDHPEKSLVSYNVFVLTATLPEMLECLPHLLSRVQDVCISNGQSRALTCSGAHTDGPDAHVSKEDNGTGTILKANTINFAQREKEEMRDLTKATEILSTPALPDHLAASSPSAHWNPALGQIFLGNASDVPLADEWLHPPQSNPPNSEDPFDYSSNDPALGYGYDICIECHDLASFPSSNHLQASDEHLAILDATWASRYSKEDGHEIPIRPPPNANSVVHLSFPSSPPSTGATVSALAPFVAFLDRWLRMPGIDAAECTTPSARRRGMTFSPSSLPQPTSFTNAFFSTASSGPYTRVRSTSASYSPYGYPSSYHPRSQAAVRTRPMKILIYSSDGYTESSVLALCLLMAMRGLSLPQAYLELQVAKKRSFFVYQGDLGLLKRVEAKLGKDRGSSGMNSSQYLNGVDAGTEVTWNPGRSGGKSVANSISGPGGQPHSASTQDLPSEQQHQIGRVYPSSFRRPRASTMPMMPAFTDHQSWFNDPRFNGSFPSRVLPFLYLGDL
jgi:dual specificity MAP kinase phosphatase